MWASAPVRALLWLCVMPQRGLSRAPSAVEDAREPAGYVLRGDVDVGVHEVAARVSPVPGGVAALTVAMLLQNVVACAQRAAAATEGGRPGSASHAGR